MMRIKSITYYYIYIFLNLHLFQNYGVVRALVRVVLFGDVAGFSPRVTGCWPNGKVVIRCWWQSAEALVDWLERWRPIELGLGGDLFPVFGGF